MMTVIITIVVATRRRHQRRLPLRPPLRSLLLLSGNKRLCNALLCCNKLIAVTTLLARTQAGQQLKSKRISSSKASRTESTLGCTQTHS